MKIDLFTIKLVFLLFPGMVGLLAFQLALYEKRELKISEFLLYSTIISIIGYFVKFNELISFLNSTTLNLKVEFLLIGTAVSTIFSFALAIALNKGYLHWFFNFNHSGKTPMIEELYLNEAKFLKYLKYYAQIRTKDKLYLGVVEKINQKGEYVEFLITEVEVHRRDQDNKLTLENEFFSLYLCLKNNEFTLEFQNQ